MGALKDVMDLVSTIAVVGSLGVVSFQIFQNTEAKKSDSYQALIGGINEYRYRASSSEMIGLFRKYNNDKGWSNFSVPERIKYAYMRSALWGQYEIAFYAEQHNVLGTPEWERFQRIICRNYQIDSVEEKYKKDSKIVVWPTIKLSLTTEFSDFITKNCQ